MNRLEHIVADDMSNRGAQDRSRINVNEDHELRYWTQKFGVDADTLRRAVKAVGVGAAAVEAHLGQARTSAKT